MGQTTYAILGYGNRGKIFSTLLKKPEYFARVVAVAEPDADRRAQAARDWDLPPERVFDSAEAFLAQPKLADAVIDTTMDKLHVRSAVPAMKKGYHLFLEKPMAVSLEDCELIERTQRESGVMMAVCHSLRYHAVYDKIKQLLDAGEVGELVTFDQLEGVGDVHYTHSYVRGNWANEEASSFILMTKTCHDIDLFSYLTGRQCKSVASFGSLTYFTAANKPQGAADRCLDGCEAERSCPYSARKIYLEETAWRVSFPRQDDASIVEYLQNGPFGRCVFGAGNNVADHQVVIFEYEGGVTGTFTVTAFTQPRERMGAGGRFIRLHGTKGTIECDIESREIQHVSFTTSIKTRYAVPVPASAHHGGADALILESFTRAVRTGDSSQILTSAQQSLASHRVVFAAEQARREGRTVYLTADE